MDAIKSAQAVMNCLVAERRIQNVLFYETALSADRFCKAGEEGQVFQRLKNYVRPLIVVQAGTAMADIQTFYRRKVKVSVRFILNQFSGTVHST